ncbi:helix-turn-helix domain-containing protein [Mesorhizobium sp.]|uniref:helix-turn-helix domain-containing protein n=1 Tax=Mesorhizobium sp. TaxID=1871066 RepID=UPI0025D93574|nr:helix-turn-helix domain-containing protein [Mesorhizobium sp.]
MTLRDDYVAALERRIDELEHRVRALEEISGAQLDAPLEFGLTRNESVIFGLLVKNAMVRRDGMMEVLYMHKQDEAEIKIVDVWVCKMRQKLKPWGIRIETVWGRGYAMPSASKAIVAGILGDRAA